jgi:primosomal protein N' (replication factor Y) (superfamily II helicase)
MLNHNSQLFVDVILPLALPGTFTYNVPDEMVYDLDIGKRVIVQFGKKKIYTALIKDIHYNPPLDYETKSIIAIIDSKPTVNELQFQFWTWISEYYMCTVGEIMKAALPSGLKLESETVVYLNEDADDDIENLNEHETTIIATLKTKKTCTIDELEKIIPKTKVIPTLNLLLEKDVVFVSESIQKSYSTKKEYYVFPNSDFTNSESIQKAFEETKQAPKQQELLLTFIKLMNDHKANKESKGVLRKKLLEVTDCSPAVLKALIDKEILKISTVAVSRLDFSELHQNEVKTLNEYQQNAISEIKKEFESKDVCLLHGVTSSGKTEIYIHLIKEVIDKGKQVLYLLPEIALTAQIINRLKNVFGNKVGIYHSKFSDAERVETWANINKLENENSYQIILGVRSSIFLPFSNLGLIIVDEEHETSYKQFDPAPRYNARDSAIVLANMHKAKVLLGTATPAIETYFNAKKGKFGLVEILQRHKDIALPQIIIVDLIDARKRKLMHSHFSKTLIDEIKTALDNKEQVILFQNRRGFSPYLECKVCGHIYKCQHCDVSLTYHKFSNSLICHYCGFTRYNDGKCQACKSMDLEMQGFGTEKIEDEIKIFFPDVKVARMDLDTTRAKNAYSKLIEQFENRDIDILIGTQMITKGLDFDNVSLVGILKADSLLNMPDFRAFERGYQLMTQVAGRAGRSKKQGKVIIQTSSVKHIIIENVINSDYHSMFTKQLNERKAYKYPPYYKLLKISIKHKDQNIVDQASAFLGESLKKIFGARILGPEYPPINRIQNMYIKNILIKIELERSYAKAKVIVQKHIDNLKSTQNYKSVVVVINVDPY